MSDKKENLKVIFRRLAPVVLLPVLLGGCGTAAHLVDMSYMRDYSMAPVAAPNPSLDGPYTYRTYFYGSGDDKHRKEYGKGVDFKTDPVNAGPFMGFFDKLDRYWGFDFKHLPLNGRVWFPDGPGPFPLVLIVHGNHAMKRFSDRGYDYLGTLLASRGFITVSVDENFLNQDFAGENDARAFLLLEHLRVWRRWNETEGHEFQGKVDMDRIALIGHSRGGEAAVHAAAFNQLTRYPDDANIQFDYGFSIRSVVAIAPCDGQYKPAGHPTTLEEVNYLVIQGGHDSDVRTFMGLWQFNRVRFTGGDFRFKSAIYVYQANHSRFNTDWGNLDAVTAPAIWTINEKPILGAAKQRRVAKVLISAFLEATLNGKDKYLPIFADVRNAGAWLPGGIYVNRYQDSTFRVIAGFEEDFDVTTATIPGAELLGENLVTWKEAAVPSRTQDGPSRENSAVVLEWDNKDKDKDESMPAKVGSYTIDLSPEAVKDLGVNRDVKLALSVAAEDVQQAEPLDLTIELADTDGNASRMPLDAVGLIHPALTIRLFKWMWLEKTLNDEPAERLLQTYQIPMARFIEDNASFDPAKLRTIRFLFDRSDKGTILLDDVGISL